MRVSCFCGTNYRDDDTLETAACPGCGRVLFVPLGLGMEDYIDMSLDPVSAPPFPAYSDEDFS